MSTTEQLIKKVCQDCQNDRTRLMDVVAAVQKEFGHVSQTSMEQIARELKIHPVEVKSVVTFYAFFSEAPKGKVVIRLCNDVVDKMAGVDAVAEVFKSELGIGFGETSSDGAFSLEWTPCMGMCDQAPTALVNEVVVTKLTADKAKAIVKELKGSGDPAKLVTEPGDGNNADDLVRAMVQNNILKTGEVIFADRQPESGLKKAVTLTPDEVVKEVKDARLRGRGGAGFPTGMKWEFTRAAEGKQKFVICNADEGEPGTFKDRVLLTEKYDMLFEGMAIAGYAIGAEQGLVYLRGEYAYLKKFLEDRLQKRRDANLLGKDILGKAGFHFDIRIQMGAGAYICGEESALISSCEGLRGDPKTRPPFPAQKGYLASPTSVNNVETLCSAAFILEKGSAAFAALGTKGSSGTKLLSISGDCAKPGVYEFPIGVSVRDILAEAGASGTQAVLIGGPSGQFINPDQFDRVICYDDLATGGAFVVFGKDRNLLEIAKEYMEFFIEESCGYCTPCRAGNVLLNKRLEKVLEGKGEASDLDYLLDLCSTIKKTSRCGLGQTSPNPVETTIKNFRPLYEALIQERDKGYQTTFNIEEALQVHEALAGRKSEIFNH